MGAELTVYDTSASPELDPALALHRGGKLEVRSTVPLRGPSDLSLAYTPGVARASSAIADDPELVHELTWKANTVAVVTDGSAVLGLGNIGPEAALPVMEGKALLLKELAGIDAVPICLNCPDLSELVETVRRLTPTFGAVSLAEIAYPRCYEALRRLRHDLSVPVFQDDEHGAAIVVAAALLNAARLTERTISETTVVVGGCGAVGVAVTRMLLALGVADVIMCDRHGALHVDRNDLTPFEFELAVSTNLAGARGDVADVLRGADVFVGGPGSKLSDDALAGMATDAIVFTLNTPGPEIDPEVVWQHAAVVATARGDHANQISGLLALPGMVRGTLDVRATVVTDDMKLAAAQALADLVGDDLAPEYVIPGAFDRRVVPAVAGAVAHRARADGVAQR
ncbi:MAG: NAD(P)-dependent malic enzyme [Actinomycetota bacterium]